jgi:hypothetical protein
MNFSALGIPPAECFVLAYEQELRPGKYRRTGWARPWQEEMAERAKSRALAIESFGSAPKAEETTAA